MEKGGSGACGGGGASRGGELASAAAAAASATAWMSEGVSGERGLLAPPPPPPPPPRPSSCMERTACSVSTCSAATSSLTCSDSALSTAVMSSTSPRAEMKRPRRPRDVILAMERAATRSVATRPSKIAPCAMTKASSLPARSTSEWSRSRRRRSTFRPLFASSIDPSCRSRPDMIESAMPSMGSAGATASSAEATPLNRPSMTVPSTCPGRRDLRWLAPALKVAPRPPPPLSPLSSPLPTTSPPP